MIVVLQNVLNAEVDETTRLFVDLDHVIAYEFKYPVNRVQGVRLFLSSGECLEFSTDSTKEADLMDLVTALSQRAKAKNSNTEQVPYETPITLKAHYLQMKKKILEDINSSFFGHGFMPELLEDIVSNICQELAEQKQLVIDCRNRLAVLDKEVNEEK